MSRTVKEWIGATDDSPVPPRVKLRVYLAHGGVCHISGRKIGAGDRWDCDHIRALCNGGENRESNLAPALVEHHREKTAEDVAMKAKADRLAKKHLGIAKPKPVSPWKRKVDGTVVRRNG